VYKILKTESRSKVTKSTLGGLLALYLVVLPGCSSVPMASSEEDAAAKKFEAPEGDNAGIYIYRNEIFGAAITMNIDIDDQNIGQTASKTYLYKEVKPGKHIATSKSENESTVIVDAKKGGLSYLWQEVKMGALYARTKLHLVTEAEGQKGVLESKLAVTH
jgi:hypothetical protein